MGVNYKIACFLAGCSSRSVSAIEKVDFSRTITLGRQFFGLSWRECERLFDKRFGRGATDEEKTVFYDKLEHAVAQRYPQNRYSEPFFETLVDGKSVIDSLDYSEYEDSTVIQDISAVLPDELKEKYSCVFDGGLLEHIYNYPVALRNAMDMVAIGGHFISATPGNNWFGHGFYQFSPEVFYSVLREENGFTDTRVYLCGRHDRWYLVNNPRVIHRRVEVSPKWPEMSLFVVSRKMGKTPDEISAYQSDYEDIWAQDKEKNGGAGNGGSGFGRVARGIYHRLPFFMQSRLREDRKRITYMKRFRSAFTRINV